MRWEFRLQGFGFRVSERLMELAVVSGATSQVTIDTCRLSSVFVVLITASTRVRGLGIGVFGLFAGSRCGVKASELAVSLFVQSCTEADVTTGMQT